MRCRARTEGYIGARGLGGSQWEGITRIAVWEPSDASERTADARGGRAARVRDPEAAGGGGVAGRTRVFVWGRVWLPLVKILKMYFFTFKILNID